MIKPPILIEENKKTQEIIEHLNFYGFDDVEIVSGSFDDILEATFGKEFGYCVAGSFLRNKEDIEEFVKLISEINEAQEAYFLKALPIFPSQCVEEVECVKKVILEPLFLPFVIDGMYHSCEVAASIAKDSYNFAAQSICKDKDRDNIAPRWYANNVVYYPKNGFIDYKGQRLSMSHKLTKLLYLLFESMGKTVSKNILLEQLGLPNDASLRVMINKAKAIVKDDFVIYNLRGIGYGIEPKGATLQEKFAFKEVYSD